MLYDIAYWVRSIWNRRLCVKMFMYGLTLHALIRGQAGCRHLIFAWALTCLSRTIAGKVTTACCLNIYLDTQSPLSYTAPKKKQCLIFLRFSVWWEKIVTTHKFRNRCIDNKKTVKIQTTLIQIVILMAYNLLIALSFYCNLARDEYPAAISKKNYSIFWTNRRKT